MSNSAEPIIALILAAGMSSRMGQNKLLIEIHGRPVIDYTIDAALKSNCAAVILVVGHESRKMRALLANRPVAVVENDQFTQGLASSLRAGIAALPTTCAGVIVCLGDMPDVGSSLLNQMIAAFSPNTGKEIVVPMRKGKRGNPVLWGRRFFPDLLRLQGDVGAKHLLDPNASFVAEIETLDDSILIDIDTPQALSLYLAAHR